MSPPSGYGYSPFSPPTYPHLPANSPKKMSTAVSKKTFFDRLPQETLQQIAELVIDPSEYLLDGREDPQRVVERLLAQSRFSITFADAMLRTFSRKRVLQIPVTDILGMAQRTRGGRLLFYENFAFSVLTHEFTPFSSFELHRELALSVETLRRVKLGIAYLDGDFQAGFSRNVFEPFTAIISQIHHALPGLQTLQVHVVWIDWATSMQRVSPGAIISAEKMRALSRSHDNFFRLAVVLNKLQQYVPRVQLVLETGQNVIIDVGGSWSTVMERLRHTCLFQEMGSHQLMQYFDLAWVQLGTSLTRPQRDESGDYEMTDEVVAEDGPNMVSDYMAQRFGLEY